MFTFKLRTIATLVPVLLVGVSLAIPPAQAQTEAPGASAKSFTEAVDQAIAAEHRLMQTLRNRQPLVETYIQELTTDPEMGAVPQRDFYFLGKLDLSHGLNLASFTSAGSVFDRSLHMFAKTASWNNFFPSGFASRMFIDDRFERSAYRFDYIKREFLGDVRCIVIDLRPYKTAGKGRFYGRIWVEDRDFNVVRFSGLYTGLGAEQLHFDSWRVNAGPNLWLPAAIYTEENSHPAGLLKTVIVRAQTRIWNYESRKERTDAAFTNLVVDLSQGVKDQSDQAAEPSPVEANRLWQRQAEDNVIERLQHAGLISPAGEVDNVLDTVLNNLEVTNNLNIDLGVRVRIMPTTPLESIAVGYTIVVSRGIIDVLPDEACLAAVLAHELAHIVLGHSINTRYAFADRLSFEDGATLKTIELGRTPEEEQAADAKAIELLKNSPYQDKLSHVGLFLRTLSARSQELPHLIRPLVGDEMANGRNDMRLAALMNIAPELQLRSTDQVSALPLGSRVKMDPWSDQLQLIKTRNVRLLNASEKMPFQVTPFMLHLTREDEKAMSEAAVAENTPINENVKR
ncbi:MAG: M48 family metalloprotease [Acidobacteriaceae bacterium]|nr:M48 family metalloprotease [Acidobacteriaceae bacterium]